MTCLECRTRLQDRLDQRQTELATLDVTDHLADCSHCRELYALSESSWSGTTVSPFYAAPDGFAERVLRQASTHRRRRQSHWFALALAFSFFLVAMVGSTTLLLDRMRPTPAEVPTARGTRPNRQVELARLVDRTKRMSELPKEGWEATARWATDAGTSARRFLPEQPLALADPVSAGLRPVKAVGDTLAHSFEPVATRAERAYEQLKKLVPDR